MYPSSSERKTIYHVLFTNLEKTHFGIVTFPHHHFSVTSGKDCIDLSKQYSGPKPHMGHRVPFTGQTNPKKCQENKSSKPDEDVKNPATVVAFLAYLN